MAISYWIIAITSKRDRGLGPGWSWRPLLAMQPGWSWPAATARHATGLVVAAANHPCILEPGPYGALHGRTEFNGLGCGWVRSPAPPAGFYLATVLVTCVNGSRETYKIPSCFRSIQNRHGHGSLLRCRLRKCCRNLTACCKGFSLRILLPQNRVMVVVYEPAFFILPLPEPALQPHSRFLHHLAGRGV